MKFSCGFFCLILVSVLALSSAVIAEGTVYSIDIVGFNRVDVEPGLDIIAMPFLKGTNTLSEVLGTNGTANASETLADNVYLYVPGTGYQTFWLYDDSDGASFNRKWVDGAQVATNIVTAEMGFWIRNRGTKTNEYILSGDVVVDDVITNTIVPGLQVLSYQYSTDIVLGDLACTNGAADSSETLADNIYLYVPGTGYQTFWLYDDSDGASFERKWVDGMQVATNVIKAGQGFWYRSRSLNDEEWIEVRPYPVD